MSKPDKHALSELSPDELHIVLEEPRTAAGERILHKISGSDRPYRSLDEMHADGPDPYGQQIQAAFEDDQSKDDE